jgi:hypothetical protein
MEPAHDESVQMPPAEKAGRALGILIVGVCIAGVLGAIAYAYVRNSEPAVVVSPLPPYLESTR